MLHKCYLPLSFDLQSLLCECYRILWSYHTVIYIVQQRQNLQYGYLNMYMSKMSNELQYCMCTVSEYSNAKHENNNLALNYCCTVCTVQQRSDIFRLMQCLYFRRSVEALRISTTSPSTTTSTVTTATTTTTTRTTTTTTSLGIVDQRQRRQRLPVPHRQQHVPLRPQRAPLRMLYRPMLTI